MQVKRRSSLWFLLPIIFNIVGGIIAYFVIKEDDPKKAKNCLYLGIILAALPILLIVIPLLIGITLFPHFTNPSVNLHYM
jgi:heme/copper-type cytochrome/quinol oxidase subunit 2